MKYKRIFTIVIDSFGIGAAKNANEYGDDGSDTFGHIDALMDPFEIPNLMKLGLGNLHETKHAKARQQTIGYATKLCQASIGKDTMTGHWEMMGLYIDSPFITFSNHGFPQELLDELSQKTGHGILGNKAASGTEILEELGEQSIQSNNMIVYTSADSVLQICASEETFGLEELYRCCQIARQITMKPEWKVGRVIARPFIGKKKGEFVRTSNRHDYALKPYGKTVLNSLKDNHYDVISIGKINDIFVGEGITQAYKSKSSVQGMQQTIEIMDQEFTGLCFVNLVDFDALWGHRRNPIGYGKELEKFDILLGELLTKLKDDDLLMISADHGNDPTFKGTDHTKEDVPLLLYSPSMKETHTLPDRTSFADIGATIAENFQIPMPEHTIGQSLLKQLK